MAEQTTNGDALVKPDVEMKEESAHETLSAVQPTLTDPIPPAQAPESTATQADMPTTQEPAPPVTVAAAATPTASTPRPSSIPPPPVTVKSEKPVAHGGSSRQFLNQNITPHLLEGMKYLAVYEPEKPLLWLSEFLKDRSKEVEGS